MCDLADPVMALLSAAWADFMYIACAHARSAVVSSKWTNLDHSAKAPASEIHIAYSLLLAISSAVTVALFAYLAPLLVVLPTFLRIERSLLDNSERYVL